jgi:hypothetical protein
VLADLPRERRVRSRVVAVDAAPEDGDCDAVGFERTSVRFGVDPARETADDDRARGGEFAAEPAPDMRAVAGARAGADDRDAHTLQYVELCLAANVENRRRIVNRAQERRQLMLPQDARHCGSSAGER